MFPQNSSWWAYVKEEFNSQYFVDLEEFLNKEQRSNKVIFPPEHEIFQAFKLTSFDQLKVVIIGQDPYHGDEQACGLLFSVRHDMAIPPSLKNIYKEMNIDIGFAIPKHGDLSNWAKQGVLLLNSILTVERKLPASHRKRGWEKFTDSIIDIISERHKGIVFVLWGAFARKKGKNIDRTKHLVLEANHPSPLSAYRGFFGCKHFSQINQFLKEQNKCIDWTLY